MKGFLKTPDIVDLFERSPRTIHRWVKSGKFPKPAINQQGAPAMWRREDIEAFYYGRKAS